MYLRNGANGPKSSTALFCRVRLVAAAPARTGAKSDAYDCFVLSLIYDGASI